MPWCRAAPSLQQLCKSSHGWVCWSTHRCLCVRSGSGASSGSRCSPDPRRHGPLCACVCSVVQGQPDAGSSGFTPMPASAAFPTASCSFAPWLQQKQKLLGFRPVRTSLVIPKSALEPFGQSFPSRCFTEAVLYNLVFGVQPPIGVGWSKLPVRVIHVPDIKLVGGKSTVKSHTEPSGDTTGPVAAADTLSRLQQCHFEGGWASQSKESIRHMMQTSWKATGLNCVWTCAGFGPLLRRAQHSAYIAFSTELSEILFFPTSHFFRGEKKRGESKGMPWSGTITPTRPGVPTHDLVQPP